MSQTWALSQTANKASGTCSVCRAVRQLHHKDGTVHKHGPRSNPCPGSNKPPLSAVSGGAALSQPVSQSQTLVSTTQSDVAGVAPISWSPSEAPIMKHIPKSARPSCASQMATLFQNVVYNPEKIDSWLKILNWPMAVLQPVKRGESGAMCLVLSRTVQVRSQRAKHL